MADYKMPEEIALELWKTIRSSTQHTLAITQSVDTELALFKKCVDAVRESLPKMGGLG